MSPGVGAGEKSRDNELVLSHVTCDSFLRLIPCALAGVPVDLVLVACCTWPGGLINNFVAQIH